MNSNELKGFTCSKCHWSDVFPTQICPKCHGPTSETTFPSQGHIATFTVIRYPPQGFEKESPYVVALIDIQNGPRAMGRINASPDGLKIGQEVKFLRNTNGLLEFIT
jgi:uncharacterized OB-fold protein